MSAQSSSSVRGFLRRLRAINLARRQRWHGPDTTPWGGADWSNAMCGEAGEAANVVKKIRRHETGIASDRDGSLEELRGKLGDELADTLIYADLLADHYGIDLQAAVVRKFNAVSEREDYPERLQDSDPNEIGFVVVDYEADGMPNAFALDELYDLQSDADAEVERRLQERQRYGGWRHGVAAVLSIEEPR